MLLCFIQAINTLCEELFLSRVNQPLEEGERSLASIVERVPSWEQREETVKGLVNLELPSPKVIN